MKRSYQFYFWPTIITLIALLTFLALGTWQVYRLQWKKGLITKVEERIDNPPINELPETTKDDWLFHVVSVTGEYTDIEFHLFAPPIKPAGKTGYNIFAVFRTIQGQHVIVDRGWVPKHHKEKATRTDSLDGKPELFTVTGILLESDKKPLFAPDPQLDQNMWFWVDLERMANEIDGPVFPYYIKEVKQQGRDDDVYIKATKEIKLRNDHFQYAIIWFTLAVAVIIIYGVYSYKEKK